MNTFEYLELLDIDTTGLKQYQLDVETAPNPVLHSTHNTITPARVVIIGASLSSEAEKLLTKMLGAINIKPQEYSICIELPDGGYKLAFFLDKNTYHLHQDAKHFYLPNPEHILQHPELKKEAWDILKRASSSI